MRERMYETQAQVHEKLHQSQVKQKRIYDRNSSERKFDIGDQVLVLLPTPGSELESKWQGVIASQRF